MANREQLKLLKAGVKGWNKWRIKNIDVEIDLKRSDLKGANLKKANLKGANLSEADLRKVNLRGADLSGANLDATDFSSADLVKADFSNASLISANLRGANLNDANLWGACLWLADLRGVDLIGANLRAADVREAKLNKAKLRKVNLSEADLSESELSDANLSESNLIGAKLRKANLRGVNLNEARLNGAYLWGANLSKAQLIGAYLRYTNLGETNLIEANLSKADLSNANLNDAKLNEADLRGAILSHSNLVGTDVSNAKISKCNVHGSNVWDLVGEFKEQSDLIITPVKESAITVDNIEIAQFIYLIMNNKKIRNVINTLTSKAVLILGRFAHPERKAILDGLRDKLREYDLLPIVFDFDRPTDKDFTETIKTLAGISYFVIADVTNPKSSPLELQATVPDYQIPFVPIIQEGESPFAMMVDLQKKYNWVLDTISYDSLDTLIEILKPHIIDPAIKMRDKLRIIKAKEPTIISGRELKEKQGKP